MAKACPKCGLLNPPEGQRCDCGYNFATQREGPSEVASQYKGVGGWLLWLCLGLTVFSPLLTLAMLTKSYLDSAQYFARVPALATLVAVDTILSVALMAFSIYAGLGLWRSARERLQLPRGTCSASSHTTASSRRCHSSLGFPRK